MSAQDELDRQMRKLKAMGVTVEVKLWPGQAFEPDRPASLIAKAARRHGIDGRDREPHVSGSEG
jgi:hypothetical protein